MKIGKAKILSVKKRTAVVILAILLICCLALPTYAAEDNVVKFLSSESLPWTGEGCGIHYIIRFTVTGQTMYHISVGDNLLTVNNEDPILSDRWCRITVDDGREFQPKYQDYYAGWSESRKSISRGVNTCGVFDQPVPEGLAPGQTVTVEVWQRATTMQDVLQPQLLCAYVTDPHPGDERPLVYGLVVFDDSQRKEVYRDTPFYPSYASIETAGKFSDVFVTDYYAPAVNWASDQGITSGTTATSFSPASLVTRAQVVTFLWRAAGCPEATHTAAMFKDVDPDAYYAAAVEWAVSEGITEGTSETTFSPDAVCTRGQIVTFLARFSGVEDADTASAFTDVKSTDYFAAAVKWAKDNNVTDGTSATTFSPNADCTRAQVVTFLYRWMVK